MWPEVASPVSGRVTVKDNGVTSTFGQLRVEAAEPVFEGHYPGFAIFPGVCVVECVHQTAVGAAHLAGLRLTDVESTHFLSPVFPGDELTIEISWTPDEPAWRGRAVASTERGEAARLRLRYGPEPAEVAEPDGSAQTPTGRGMAAGARTASFASTPELKRLLPHRYPMLLVDHVSDVEPGARLTARKAVTCNEPWYRRLPADADESQHAYPPVLLVESWCQAAGVLATWDAPNPDVLSGQVMLFGSMAGIRFPDAVTPGDAVEHRVRLARALSDTMIFEGEGVVGERRVLEIGRVVMTMRPASELATAHHSPAMSG